ncbi:MAG: hypothetical protein LBB50_03750, partial [Oscillospiraceae bacterium]|nr:hypothetical protein [Oscillospiraceae bacterium]
MKKTHKTSFAKRTFSLLLCAAMLAGLFVGVQVSTSLVAQAGLAKVPVGDFPAVNFSVPDTIWLAPNASNSMNSMRYYGNVGIDGVREANASDTGKVYFSMAGATSITLKVSGASFGNTSGFGPSSNSLAASFSGGTLGSSLSAGTGTRITWTLEFTYEGAVYTCRGYSYVQAPTLNVVGAAASTNTYYGLSPTYYHSDGLFLMGVHSVSGSVSTGNSKYTPNAQGTYGPNDTLRAQLISGNADGSAWPNERYLTSGGGIGYARIDSHSGDNGDLHLNVGGTTGVFTVDVSRFDNLNQVPGLIGAHVLTDADETHDGFRDNSRIEFPSGTKIAGLSGGGGRGFYWRTTNPASGSGSLHLGLSASNTSTETKGFWSYLEIGRNVFLGNYGNLEHYLSFNLTIIKSNKAALRKAVRDAISVPIEFYGSNLAALDSKLQSAVDQLGSVTTTETTMAQELNAAVNGYKDPGVVPIKSAPDINFVVPETIYLALTTSGAMSTFSSYANGGAVTRSTGASGTGTVSFSMQGATNIKIENGGTGPSANCAAFNATGLSATAANNSYSSNFAGSLAAGIDARATATICWKATW